MQQTWNEIRTKARRFSVKWKGEERERSEAQTFYNDFFEIFGKDRRAVAVFERRAKKLSGNTGFIDVFMPNVLLAEHKSRGKDLDAAIEQAEEYFLGLKDKELPKLLLACDFQTFDIIDLDTRERVKFNLEELDQHVEWFAPIMGAERRVFEDQLPVNVRAAELVGELHDALLESKFSGTDLEKFLVRIVFCLFADDTMIFGEKNRFLRWLYERTGDDGDDLGMKLHELFEVLNQPQEERSPYLEETTAAFPYINGDLFKDATATPRFNSAMRQTLIDACEFDWEPISPAIFGSLFQSVMDKKKRREVGAHYTSESNIMKAIEPLFLDDLRAEFESIRRRRNNRREMLESLHVKLGGIKILDPACGCGNFLVIAYRELRQLEIDLLVELYPDRQLDLEREVRSLSRIDVDQFYGIEYEEFPSEIARTTMWMMDHLMNRELSRAFGIPFARIPLKASAAIHHGDALLVDWATILPPAEATYIIGNPPFVGHQWRTKEQKKGMHSVWGREGKVNRLDYVTAWFRRAVEFMHRNPKVRTAFVSTNSITQGEQAGILWSWMFKQGVSIGFAHRTFQWNSEARGTAAVHCVVIGFQLFETEKVTVYEYADVRDEPYSSKVDRLNAYLIDGPNYSVPSRTKTPDDRPPLNKGSQPTDGTRYWKRLWKKEGRIELDGPFPGNLILDNQQRAALLSPDRSVGKWLRPYIGGEELISGEHRWCLWLKNADPGELRRADTLKPHLDRVRYWRTHVSPTPSVNDMGRYPTLFTQDRQPQVTYLGLPEVSSENREYIPIAYCTPDIVASNKLQIVESAPMWIFGLITSAMHMGWMRTVTGRLKSDYSYSPAVYNSFPFPKLTKKKRQRIADAAQSILDARRQFPKSTLEDLYDRDSMPPELRDAHERLDRLVDSLYRKKRFRFERERVEHLFELLTQREAPLSSETAA